MPDSQTPLYPEGPDPSRSHSPYRTHRRGRAWSWERLLRHKLSRGLAGGLAFPEGIKAGWGRISSSPEGIVFPRRRPGRTRQAWAPH